MNNTMFSLDERLAQCAAFVPTGATVADIGTDHAYLPVWLAKNGIVKHAIAADINPLPLNRGKATILKYEAQDTVETRLSNGLMNIYPQEMSHIIIAGMGGELIANIIQATPWIADKQKTLILQPMTRSYVLREYLYSNGYEIKQEKAVESDGRIYTVMLAVHTDSKQEYDTAKLFTGELSPDKFPLDKSYVQKQIDSLTKKAQGMAESNPDAAADITAVIAKLQETTE